MEYILKTEKLTKIYGGIKAVNEVSMSVRKGDIYGFIGKNGAGKTTFMKMISGLATPTAGSMELFGKSDLEQSNFYGCYVDSAFRGIRHDTFQKYRRSVGIWSIGRVNQIQKSGKAGQ